MTTNWASKRIKAMNRKIGKGGSAVAEHYLDEYYFVINSKANNKKEYKLERKKNEKTNGTNVSSD